MKRLVAISRGSTFQLEWFTRYAHLPGIFMQDRNGMTGINGRTKIFNWEIFIEVDGFPGVCCEYNYVKRCKY